MLIAQDRLWVEHLRRQSDGRWILNAMDQVSESLLIESIGCDLPLGEICRNVTVPGSPSAHNV